MIDRQSTYYYVALAALCLLVVITFNFYLKNYFEETLEPVKKQQGPPAGPASTEGTQDRDYLTPIIWNEAEKQKTIQPFGTSRNPFLWPGEMEAVSEGGPLPPVPQLGMIIVSQENRLAFLDQKLVYEGSQHSGFRVEKIAPGAVTLSHAGGKLQLIAPDDHFGPAKVKRLERSRP